MQDPEEADMPVPRERLLEAAWPEMPYGESGEAAPSLIPYQVIFRFHLCMGRLLVSSYIRRDGHCRIGVGLWARVFSVREFYASS